jgi:elongation factor Ts
MAVDPAKVKELREKTGLPMMDCKRAIEKTEGDVEKAYEELRKSGLKAQEKLAGRTASQGRVGSYVSPDGKVGVLVALRCETEPVGQNENFQKFLADLVQVIAKENPKDASALPALRLSSGETVSEGLTELVNRIRENIMIGRFARFEADAIGQYVHFDQKKAAMVALQGGAASNPKVAELGKDLSMHVVFSSQLPTTTPKSVGRSGVPAELIEKEREVLLATARNDPKNSKKPPEILQKMIHGQVEAFVTQQFLLGQASLRDPKVNVEEQIKRSGAGVTVKDFVYIATDQG